MSRMGGYRQVGMPITENIGNLGKVRQTLIPKARHTHWNTPHGGADFYPLLAEVGKDVIEGKEPLALRPLWRA